MSELKTSVALDWRQVILDERERKLVNDCVRYSQGDAAGLPGHNILLIIAKMADLLDRLDAATANEDSKG